MCLLKILFSKISKINLLIIILHLALVSFSFSSPLQNFSYINNNQQSNTEDKNTDIDNLINILKDPKQAAQLANALESIQQKSRDSTPTSNQSNDYLSGYKLINTSISSIENTILIATNIIKNTISLEIFKNNYYKFVAKLNTLNLDLLDIFNLHIIMIISLYFLIEYGMQSLIPNIKYNYSKYYKYYHQKSHFKILFIMCYWLKIISPLIVAFIGAILGEYLLSIFWDDNYLISVIQIIISLFLIRILFVINNIYFFGQSNQDIMLINKWIKRMFTAGFIFYLLSEEINLVGDINILKIILASILCIFLMFGLIKIIYLLKIYRKYFIKYFRITSTLLVCTTVLGLLISYVTQEINFYNKILFNLFLIITVYLGLYVIRIFIIKIFFEKLTKIVLKYQAYLTTPFVDNFRRTQTTQLKYFLKLLSILTEIILVSILIVILGYSFDSYLLYILKDIWNNNHIIIIIFNIIFISIIFLLITFTIIYSVDTTIVKLFYKNKKRLSIKLMSIYLLLRPVYIIVISIIYVGVILNLLHISLTTILASTGLATLIVAFGMKDILANFFNAFIFMINDSLSLGDYVEIGDIYGEVESIDNIYIKIRDVYGRLNLIPFNQVRTIKNSSRDYVYAIADFYITYDNNIQHVKTLLQKIGTSIRNNANYKEFILEDLDIYGVRALDLTGIQIRCRFKTVIDQQFLIREAMYYEIQKIFNDNNIKFTEMKAIDFRD